MPPLSELMTKCAEGSRCAELFRSVSLEMNDGFEKAWQKHVGKWSKSVGLTRDELETVQMLSALGGCDINGEKHLLTTVSKRLSDHADAAREELAAKGKMLFSCSILAGLAIVIFII